MGSPLHEIDVGADLRVCPYDGNRVETQYVASLRYPLFFKVLESHDADADNGRVGLVAHVVG